MYIVYMIEGSQLSVTLLGHAGAAFIDGHGV